MKQRGSIASLMHQLVCRSGNRMWCWTGVQGGGGEGEGEREERGQGRRGMGGGRIAMLCPHRGAAVVRCHLFA